MRLGGHFVFSELLAHRLPSTGAHSSKAVSELPPRLGRASMHDSSSKAGHCWSAKSTSETSKPVRLSCSLLLEATS